MEPFFTSNIIIVGAGASGLLAARELARQGRSVHIMEARDRIGGRIHTINDPIFSRPVEMGAEFIHGKLPITLSLLKEYKLHHEKLRGTMWHVEDGKIVHTPNYILGYKELDKALNELQQDMSVRDFLDKYISAPGHRKLYENIKSFVEGYDAADIEKASALAFKKEWSDSDANQFRPKNGYAALIEALTNECIKLGVKISLNAIVKEIHWSEKQVKIVTADHQHYHSEKALVTVPLAIWQSGKNEIAHIYYHPSLPEKEEAAKQLGYGSVVKIILQFNDAYWNHYPPEQLNKKLGFLFSDKGIPTWWTYNTGDVPMLTGWVGGSPADALKGSSDKTILDYALYTLSYVFDDLKKEIKSSLKKHYVSRWTEDPFSLGAYSYSVVDGEQHKQILRQPVENTLFFAGEALDDGGTVEAAFGSAIKAVKLM